MDATTKAGHVWEIRRSQGENYTVRFRRLCGTWETPSSGGWQGHAGALHALFTTGVGEGEAKQMIALASPGKLVRLENGGEIEVLDLMA